MKTYIDSPEENEIREANYRAKIERNRLLEVERIALANQEAIKNAVVKQNEKTLENDRLRSIYQAYKNSVRYQEVLDFPRWVEQYKLNVLSAGWWEW